MEGDAVKKDILPTRDFAFAANVRLSDQFEDGRRIQEDREYSPVELLVENNLA